MLSRFLLLFFLFPAAISDLAADRDALLLLRSALGGRTTWWNLSEQSPCSWQGVSCDNTTTGATRVVQLRLPGWVLSGQIPIGSIGNLTELRNLTLRRNSLSGSIPSDLSSCTQLQSLFLQENNFSGEIPTTLFALPNLVRLSLARNRFSGEISPEFNDLTKLRILSLEYNNLTGSIPDLNNLSRLRVFNVSFNQLNGSIPRSLEGFLNDSFMGNTLCGSPLAPCPGVDGNGGGAPLAPSPGIDGNGGGSPLAPSPGIDGNGGGNKKLSAGAIAGIVIGSVFGLIVVLLVLFFLLRKTSPHTTPPQAETYQAPPAVLAPGSELNSPKPLIVRENGGDGRSRNGDVVVVNGVHSGGRDDGLVFFGEGTVVFGLEELLRAPAEVLGKGTLGSTYKAYLGGETEAVVVKRLREICVSEIEFREKVEDLGMLVHENLLPFRAYYYGREERLIVFDCVLMGSLSALLHGSTGEHRAALTWEIRTKIAFGAAYGIEYLHSLGSSISHGNIKSSNILLNDFYAARVSEYGLCQLVSPFSTLDQNGYRAPEVTDTRKISQKADVYSFGVLLLELLTGKAPIHGVLNEEGVDLPRWVSSMCKENKMIDVFDKELVRQHQNNGEEQMFELLRVGMHCTSQHPKKRPPMVEVTKQIRKVVI